MALNKLTKVQTLGIGSNIEVVGVITTGQFKSGTSNLHASGVELTNLNVSGIATIGGNVSIGGTLTYQDVTNIDSVGMITARSGVDASGTSIFRGPLQAQDNLEMAGELVHLSDNDTRIRFPANDTISFQTAGSERARFTKDGNLFVGSNVSQFYPYNSFTNDALFMVNGNLPTINGAGQATILTKAAYNASDRRAILSFGGNYSSAAQGSQTFLAGIGGEKENTTNGNFAGALMLYTRPHGGNETERLRITSTGSVGIGLTNPQKLLEIQHVDNRKLQFSYDDSIITMKGANNNGNPETIRLIGGNSIRFHTGTTGSGDERLRIDANGYLIAKADIRLRRTASNNGALYFGDTNNNYIFGSDADDVITFATANTERLRIHSDGKISVGTNTFIDGSTKFEISGKLANTSAGGQNIHKYGSASAFHYGQYNSTGDASLNNQANAIIAFATNNTERLRITNTGQLLLGETSAFDSNVAMQFRKDNAGSQSRFIFRNRGNNGSSRVRLVMSTLNRAANGDIFSGMEQYQSGGMAIFNGQSDTSHCGIDIFTGNWRPLRLKNGNVSGNDAVHIQAYWGTSNGLQMEVGGPQSGTHKAIRF